MDNPLVSVLITVYNREKYIAEAIESVLASTYTNFELIIVDDCSSDKSIEIAQSYAASDSRIRIYKNERNLGDYPNRNQAANYALGKYITYVDSDDKIYPDTIDYLVKNMEANPNIGIGMVYHGKDVDTAFVLSSIDVIKKHFFEKSILHIGPGGTILKRSFFNSIGMYPTKYGPANDMYFNIKAASNTSVLMLPYNFLFYRIHEGQEINNRFSYLHNGYRYFQDIMHLPELPLSRQERDFLLKKNKRRFLVNSLRFLLQARNLKRTREAYQLAGFSFKDLIKSILH